MDAVTDKTSCDEPRFNSRNVTDKASLPTGRANTRNAYVGECLFVVGMDSLTAIANCRNSYLGLSCGICGIDIGVVSYRAAVIDSRNNRRTTISVCDNCTSIKDHSAIERFKHSCEVCHRTVYAIRFNGTCGERCRQHRSTVRTRQKQLSHRQKKSCEVCGNTINSVRDDSCYCGNACRQKAYRQRTHPA
jgi:hypothetical protein